MADNFNEKKLAHYAYIPMNNQSDITNNFNLG